LNEPVKNKLKMGEKITTNNLDVLKELTEGFNALADKPRAGGVNAAHTRRQSALSLTRAAALGDTAFTLRS
jgi:hypothetical protein